jgi:hypothetical protein
VPVSRSANSQRSLASLFTFESLWVRSKRRNRKLISEKARLNAVHGSLEDEDVAARPWGKTANIGLPKASFCLMSPPFRANVQVAVNAQQQDLK